MAVFLFSIFWFSVESSYAKNKNSVMHSHNGRVHSHVLPKAGIRHKHGNLAFGKAIYKKSNITRKTIQKNRATLHSHSGRVHSHILPKSGLNHSHGFLGRGKLILKQNNKETMHYVPLYISMSNPRIIATHNLFIVKDVSHGGWFRHHRPIVIADYKIVPSKKALKKFRLTLDRIGVWKWKKKYYSPRTEGWRNNISIIYPDKKVKVNIISKYPGHYNEFVDAILELVQFKKYARSSTDVQKILQDSRKVKKRMIHH